MKGGEGGGVGPDGVLPDLDSPAKEDARIAGRQHRHVLRCDPALKHIHPGECREAVQHGRERAHVRNRKGPQIQGLLPAVNGLAKSLQREKKGDVRIFLHHGRDVRKRHGQGIQVRLAAGGQGG